MWGRERCTRLAPTSSLIKLMVSEECGGSEGWGCVGEGEQASLCDGPLPAAVMMGVVDLSPVARFTLRFTFIVTSHADTKEVGNLLHPQGYTLHILNRSRIYIKRE